MQAVRREALGAVARIIPPAACGTHTNWGARTFRHWPGDMWLVSASVAHLLIVASFPGIWTVALGVWWVSNTVSHNFIHQPFFRSRRVNRSFAFYLTAITGIPQRLWRDRHLAHHAETAWNFRPSRELTQQTMFLAALWGMALLLNARLAATTLLPGFVGGLVLCWLQGHYEHARGTISHYGRLYNVVFFNDGYHAEHHRNPKAHWSELRRGKETTASRWPAVLRWFEISPLDELERISCRSALLRRWLVWTHERALRKLWADSACPRRVAIIGGGLFPRSALVARRLWAEAEIVIYETNSAHLEASRRWLPEGVTLVNARVESPTRVTADLIIVPLALQGSKAAFYARQGVRRVLIHDWLWHRQGRGAVVSWLLIKRMNLVER